MKNGCSGFNECGISEADRREESGRSEEEEEDDDDDDDDGIRYCCEEMKLGINRE